MKHFILIAALLGTPCAAQAQLDNALSATHTPARQFSKKTGDITNGALAFINNNDPSRALPLLEQALNRPSLTPYEKATLYQMQGASFYELGDKMAAITSFQDAIDSQGLEPDEADNMILNIGQLYIANGQYEKGAQMLEAYANRGGKIKPNLQVLITQAWIQAEQYEKALPWAETWYAAADPKRRRDYNMLRFLYKKLGMDEPVIEKPQ